MKPRLIPRAELAYLLSLSQTRIVALIAAKVLPEPLGRGQFDLTASVQAYVEFLRSNTRGSLAQERTRLTRAKAEREEYLQQVREDRYVDREPLNKWLFEVIRTFRDKVLSIPDRVAGMVSVETDQDKNHALLTNELHQALTELSDGISSVMPQDKTHT